MKILLIGDYSNYHACLGRALADEGHQVTIASSGGGWMKTSNDISLRRPLPGKAGGMLLYTKLLFDSRLKGYDVVSLINPSFAGLRPKRLQVIFNKLKQKNGAVFLGSIGTDKAVMEFLTSADCPLRYSEYYSSKNKIYQPNLPVLEKDNLWRKGEIGDFCEFVYDNVNGVTTAIYEYHLAMERRIPSEKLCYTGIPIYLPEVIDESRKDKLNIFLGRHSYRKQFKGTDRLEIAARRVTDELSEQCYLTIVEDVPLKSYKEKLGEADIVLDQLYSYSPATNALMAMAKGKVVVSGGEPEYYSFIGEEDMFPVVNVIPDDEEIFNIIKDLVLSPEKVNKAVKEGPVFVKKHNDAVLVAKRHVDFWTSKM